jgi:hypothetical protein
MAMEAEAISEREEAADGMNRRARTERRVRDRRKPGNRVNRDAPAHSLIKVFGAFGVAIMSAVMTLTVLADQMLDLQIPAVALGLQGMLLGSFILLIALGSIEQRLIEIRLELMMMNGGRRAADDRRGGDRRRTSDEREPSRNAAGPL